MKTFLYVVAKKSDEDYTVVSYSEDSDKFVDEKEKSTK